MLILQIIIELLLHVHAFCFIFNQIFQQVTNEMF